MKALLLLCCGALAHAAPDISSVPPDLVLPAVVAAVPAAGKRVFYRLPGDPEKVPPLVLWLPVDWSKERSFPVLCEYAGNGNYQNAFGDASTGRPEGSQLGYGLSAGRGFIWACLPFLNEAGDGLATQWWGDKPRHLPDTSVAYAKRAVPAICTAFSGDASRVVLCGFSRGAIACNAIGLHDAEIAGLWCGFICYSHYDGLRTGWPFAGADAASCLQRLSRLGSRPQLICHEETGTAPLDHARAYLKNHHESGQFTFLSSGFRNHNDAWLLRPSAARDTARLWLQQVTKR
jgi:hypothetical protein